MLVVKSSISTNPRAIGSQKDLGSEGTHSYSLYLLDSPDTAVRQITRSKYHLIPRQSGHPGLPQASSQGLPLPVINPEPGSVEGGERPLGLTNPVL